MTARRSKHVLLRTAAAIACAAACAGAQAHVYLVLASPDMTFHPASITIRQGDSIRFMNYGGVHNVHADNNRFICSINCTTNNTPSDAAWSVVVRFTTIGTFGYFCDQHGNLTSGMRGSITVIDGIFADDFDTGPSPD